MRGCHARLRRRSALERAPALAPVDPAPPSHIWAVTSPLASCAQARARALSLSPRSSIRPPAETRGLSRSSPGSAVHRGGHGSTGPSPSQCRMQPGLTMEMGTQRAALPDTAGRAPSVSEGALPPPEWAPISTLVLRVPDGPPESPANGETPVSISTFWVLDPSLGARSLGSAPRPTREGSVCFREGASRGRVDLAKQGASASSARLRRVRTRSAHPRSRW